jgi:high-affinity nickel-transport protein
MFHRLFRMIRHSWHMYPLGFLFGLGFDTATEIGLLASPPARQRSGLPIWSILVFRRCSLPA